MGCSHRKDVASSAACYLEACERLGWFSGAALLASHGEVVFRDAFGMADRERRVLNQPSTRFRIGSLTKPLTAMAIHRLAERGGLDTEQPLSDFVPGFPSGSRIRIRHLLDHTSGIPDVVNREEGGVLGNRRYALREIVDLCAALPLEFEPGTACRYSSSGYILLAHVIEAVSGAGYDRFLEDQVLGPLGMLRSGAWKDEDGPPDGAFGYTIDGSDVVLAAKRDPSTVVGCGGLASTVDDLYAWDRALRSEKRGNGQQKQPVPSPAGPFVRGWRVTTMYRRRLLSHDGGIEGFASAFYRFADEHFCVALLGNLEHTCGREICTALAAILLGEPFSVPEGRRAVAIDRPALAGLEGAYRFSPSFAAHLTREEDRLFFRATRQPRFEALPFARDRFFLSASPAELSFARDGTGKVTHLLLHQAGEHLVGKRAESSAGPGA